MLPIRGGRTEDEMFSLTIFQLEGSLLLKRKEPPEH